MKIDRQKLCLLLASVYPGVAQKLVIDQSECFVFKDGLLRTFDDEVACSIPCKLGVEGAVQAKPLLAWLSKVSDDKLEMFVKDNHLVVKGKVRSCGVRMDADVVLPLDDVVQPTSWRKIAPNLTKALSTVQSCAAGENDDFCLTCIHITPGYLEACDNYQAARYPLKTGFKAELLVRKSSLAHICTMAPTRFSEADTWVHFGNDDGLVLSVRRHSNTEDYPNLDNHFVFDGQPAHLPDLSEAVEAAEIFSQESAEANQIRVKLSPGRVVISGLGVTGWAKEMKKTPYQGDPLSFLIAPRMLSELAARSSECEITTDRLRMDGEGYTYVTCLE